jgi:hypothetical protein
MIDSGHIQRADVDEIESDVRTSLGLNAAQLTDGPDGAVHGCRGVGVEGREYSPTVDRRSICS